MGTSTTSVRPGDRAPTPILPNPGPPCGSSLCERTTVAPNPLWAHQPAPFARGTGLLHLSFQTRGAHVGAHSVSEQRWHPTRYGHINHLRSPGGPGSYTYPPKPGATLWELTL